MVMSTTDRISGYKIKSHIGIAYGVGKNGWSYTNAMSEALSEIEGKYKNNPNIGIIGLRHSVSCDTEDDDAVVIVMGTLVMIEKE